MGVLNGYSRGSDEMDKADLSLGRDVKARVLDDLKNEMIKHPTS
ncbi:MAG: hypothetical protein QXU18_04280 [Thermoplasmatales archaeon]